MIQVMIKRKCLLTKTLTLTRNVDVFFISLIRQSFYPSLKIHTVKHSIKKVCGICGLGCLIFTCNPHINFCQMSYKFFGRYANLNFTWCITIIIAFKVTWSQITPCQKQVQTDVVHCVTINPAWPQVSGEKNKLWFKRKKVNNETLKQVQTDVEHHVMITPDLLGKQIVVKQKSSIYFI